MLWPIHRGGFLYAKAIEPIKLIELLNIASYMDSVNTYYIYYMNQSQVLGTCIKLCKYTFNATDALLSEIKASAINFIQSVSPAYAYHRINICNKKEEILHISNNPSMDYHMRTGTANKEYTRCDAPANFTYTIKAVFTGENMKQFIKSFPNYGVDWEVSTYPRLKVLSDALYKTGKPKYQTLDARKKLANAKKLANKKK